MAFAGDMVIRLTANSMGLRKDLMKATGTIKTFGAGSKKSFTGFGRSGKTAFGLVGAAITKTLGKVVQFGKVLGGALAIATGAAIKKNMDFDHALRTAGVRAEASEQQLENLRVKAKDLGRTTSFTATEVADMMATLGQGGFNPEEIDGMVESVMALARATGTDATLGAELMSSTMEIFGKEASEASRIADIFTTTANSTLTSVEDLAEGWKFAAQGASTLGMEVDEVAAVMGTLAQSGLKGSVAGTAFRRISTLSATTAKELEEEFGVAFTDVNNNALSVVDTMAAIGMAADANAGNAEKLTQLYEAFGLRGVTASDALIKNFQHTDSLLAKIQGSAGSANKAMQDIEKGPWGAWKRFTSAVSGLMIQIGEGLAPMFESVMTKMTGWFNSFTDFIKENWNSWRNSFEESLVIISTTFQFTWESMGDILRLAVARYILHYVKFANLVVYFYTEVLPYSVEYYARNSTVLLIDSFMYIAGGFSNMIDNMKALWDAMLEWIKTGDFEPDLKGFGDGFRRTLRDNEAFEIPDRIKGEWEKDLEGTVNNLQVKLSTGLQNRLTTNLDKLHDTQAARAAKKLDDTRPEEFVGKERTAAATAGLDSLTGAGAPSAAATGAGAMQRGSAEAFSAINKAISEEAKVTQLAKDRNKILDQIAATLAEQSRPGFVGPPAVAANFPVP